MTRGAVKAHIIIMIGRCAYFSSLSSIQLSWMMFSHQMFAKKSYLSKSTLSVTDRVLVKDYLNQPNSLHRLSAVVRIINFIWINFNFVILLHFTFPNIFRIRCGVCLPMTSSAAWLRPYVIPLRRTCVHRMVPQIYARWSHTLPKIRECGTQFVLRAFMDIIFSNIVWRFYKRRDRVVN